MTRITEIPPTNTGKLSMAKQVYKDIMEKCQLRYKIDPIAVKWDGRGATRLGYCKYLRNGNVLFIRFNMEYLYDDKSFLEMVNNTIPHEIAHAVVISKKIRETAHGPEWRRVCIELGGTGKACAPKHLHQVANKIKKKLKPPRRATH